MSHHHYYYHIWVFLLLLVSCCLASRSRVQSTTGFECAACTIAVSLLEQLSEIHNKTIPELLDDVCLLIFPVEFNSTCFYFVNTYGPQIIQLFEKEYNPDEICYAIAFCTDPTCHLWPQTGKSVVLLPPPSHVLMRTSYDEHPKKFVSHTKRKTENPWDWILDLLKPVIDKSEPVLDVDGDLFSLEPPLRGSSWRGKDCDDSDSSIYAGRKRTNYDPSVDHNCNGIYAIDGLDYERLYCQDSSQLGVAIVGDSAGAHFHIPPHYMNASAIDENTFSDLLFVLSNEFDVPQESMATGHQNTTGNVFVSSFYLKMRERNRCNHRDYQNICKNGLRSGRSVEMSKTLSRNQTTDQPLFLVFELIGNDVCSGHEDFSHFTDPEEFEQNILYVLGNFSQTLPYGSHVMFMGLAHGGILWDLLHNRTHPIGAPYSAVYDFLNCLQISPCWGWMNSNSTIRNITNAWALKLSNVYDKIISTHTYANFDMVYYPFPFEEIMKIWVSEGGQSWELIEPSDGFHPSQRANALIADWIWNDLEKNHPNFLGSINPYNDEIDLIFGDQGGY